MKSTDPKHETNCLPRRVQPDQVLPSPSSSSTIPGWIFGSPVAVPRPLTEASADSLKYDQASAEASAGAVPGRREI